MHNLNFRERIEKYYSRDIYRTIDNLLIQLHNKSPVSAFDVLEVSAAASLINHYLLNGFIDEKATVFTPITLGIYGMVHTICYSLNRARQPLEATLGLEPENEKNPSEEFQDWLFEDPKYMSRELKALGPAQEDDFDLSIIENAVRNQLIRIEGKEPGEFPKPKSFLASYIFNAVGAGGSYMSAFPEIAFVNNFHDASNLWHPLRQHAVAHELFHSKGYISEKEAEMLAHLAGMQSRIPALRRSELLYRLRRNLSIETKDGRPIKERIYEADLPDYVIEVFVKMQASQNKQEAKPKAIKLLMNSLAFGRDQLAFLLAGSRTSDYSTGFLQMAYAYEQKYG